MGSADTTPDTPPASTPVRFRLDVASPGALTTRTGKWRMTWIGRATQSDRIVTGASYDVTPLPEELAAGSFTQPLLASDAAGFDGKTGWRITEPGGTTRTVTVPTSTTEVNYADLADVDPATFDPAAPPAPGLVAAVTELAALFNQIRDAVVNGTPMPAEIPDPAAFVAGYINGTIGGTL